MTNTDMLLRTAVKAYEERYIRDVLAMCNWKVYETAKYLGISKSSLYRKIKEHKIRK